MKHLFLFIFLLSAALNVCAQQPDTLVLATYTYSTNNRIANLQPFADHLAKQTGVPVRVRSFPTVSTFITAIKAGEVDIAFINTFGYLLLEAGRQDVVSPVVALNVKKEASNNYKTMLLAHRSSGVTTLDELKQKASTLSMAFVAEGSTSGNLVPRMLLSSIGLKTPETQFEKSGYAGTHASAIAQVAAGQVDLAAFGSDEYYKLVEKNPAAKDSINVVWVSEEIPLGPVLVKNSLKGKLKKRIRTELLNLHQSNPQALQSVKNGWSEAKQSEQYVPVDDKYYDGFRNLTGNREELIEILNKFVN